MRAAGAAKQPVIGWLGLGVTRQESRWAWEASQWSWMLVTAELRMKTKGCKGVGPGWARFVFVVAMSVVE